MVRASVVDVVVLTLAGLVFWRFAKGDAAAVPFAIGIVGLFHTLGYFLSFMPLARRTRRALKEVLSEGAAEQAIGADGRAHG